MEINFFSGRTFCMALCIIFLSTIMNAQRNCGSMEHLENLMEEYPEIQDIRKSIERATEDFLINPEKAVNGVITIPVVVHVVYNTTAENISLSQINSQITVLNDDFRRLNSDANGNWPQAADSEIEFCLATVDPNGNSTNGVTRTSTSVTSFSTNDNVKFNSSGGKNAWPASDYLNVWVCDLGGGLLGYAQFPGGPANTDGVVTDYQYFGTNGTATAPFDLGRTTTHEVGHWLNLYHIWGDGPCSADDLVSDTPASDAANYGCATGHVSCGSTDMVENYMDYSDDGCMNLYTTGQKDRMRALFDTNGFRESLLNSNGCGSGTPPTCNDGVQNGNETGVDCGGPDCPPCNTGCADNALTLTIILDNYPAETTWDLKDSNGSTVASGGPYGSQSAGSTVTEDICIADGCYDFTIYDSYGDGICCAYGNGSYNLTDAGGNVMASGGNFGSSETTNFCIGPPPPTCNDGVQNGNETGVDCGGPDCPPCNGGCNDNLLNLTIVLDNYPSETTWELLDDIGNPIQSGGPYGSQSPGSTVSTDFCLADACYDFIIYDSYGDGICCAYGNGSYSLTDESGNILASGGNFGSFEQTNFCLGASGPTCSDGIQNGNETGVDCGGPDCPPCNTGCTYQVINDHNFENGWGIWNDGGSDCRRNINDSSFAYSGNYCVRLRDNTSSSTMTTDNLNLASYSEVTIDFTFIAAGMESGEDFWLQASTDGGASYQTLVSWARGSDFVNNVREFESVVITGDFTSNTKFRFRCDASQNNDRIYIDDVNISGCISSGSRTHNARGEVANPRITDSEYDIAIWPNPAKALLNISWENSRPDEAIRLRFTDMNGKIYKSIQYNGKDLRDGISIDIADLDPGLYLIQMDSRAYRVLRKFTVIR